MYIKSFSADIKNLLNIVTSRMYTDKSVFLRELISNSCDAIQKLKKPHPEAYEEEEPSIIIKIDQEKKKLLICDNGVGMSRLEIERNLSTIGYSDTKQQKASGNDLIGEFGLGFYSCFAIGKKIKVWSRKYGEEFGNLWLSDCSSNYEIQSMADPLDLSFDFGTQIEIMLKEDSEEYLNPDTVKFIVQKYMNYVPVKIFIDEFFQPVNFGQVIWNKPEITEDDHKEIFHNIVGGTGEIYIQKQKKLESNLGSNYNCFFYVSTRDYFLESDLEKKPNVFIYVNNVFVCEDSSLLPGFLSFARCFINITGDVLLVNRDFLQESGFLRQLSANLPIMILKEIVEKQENDREAYIKKFWTTYGKQLKIGASMDTSYRSLICETFIFPSKQQNKLISLSQYDRNIEKKDPKQEKRIFYSFFDQSPQLDFFLLQNKDVLIFNSVEDALWPLLSKTYGTTELFCIDSTEEDTEITGEETRILNRFSKFLGNKIERVIFSKNLYTETGLVGSFLSEDKKNNYKFARFVDFPSKPTLGLNKKHFLFEKIKTNVLNEEKEQYLFNCIYSICLINDEKIEEKNVILSALDRGIKTLFE